MDPTQILTVLIVGFGFMGENHYNNLKEFEKNGTLSVASVVDSDPTKLNNKKLDQLAHHCFQTLAEAYQGDRSYDIVVVATNTTTHNKVINEIFDCCLAQQKPLPALFVEKPLVENTAQAREMVRRMEKEWYEKNKGFTCGYLFRESPALDASLDYIQKNQLAIQKVKTIWQKLRDTNRPSAGVHIDESTHPVDVLVNYIFPILGLPTQNISLEVTNREYSRSIVNQQLQDKFYGKEHVPLAAVDYNMQIGDIQVTAHSSFKEAPQRREIWLECNQGKTIKVAFDIQKSDTLTIYEDKKEIYSVTFPEPNKLRLEWGTFLEAIRQMKASGSVHHPSPKISTLKHALRDIIITEALGNQEMGKVHHLGISLVQ